MAGFCGERLDRASGDSSRGQDPKRAPGEAAPLASSVWDPAQTEGEGN